jgi:hypothetical protein
LACNIVGGMSAVDEGEPGEPGHHEDAADESVEAAIDESDPPPLNPQIEEQPSHSSDEEIKETGIEGIDTNGNLGDHHSPTTTSQTVDVDVVVDSPLVVNDAGNEAGNDKQDSPPESSTPSSISTPLPEPIVDEEAIPPPEERDIGAILASRTNNAPRLAQPRKPVRKGVKPPTRGEPIAHKLTTKTDTDNAVVIVRPALIDDTPPPAPPPLPVLPDVPPSQPLPRSASEGEDTRPKPRPQSPQVARGGMPNFAAEALNVQLKKTAARPKTADKPPPPNEPVASAPSANPPPPVPPRPQRPPRPPRAKSLTAGALQEPIREDEGTQGYLYKRGGFFKNWKKRWFVVKEDKIYYYTRTPKGDTLRGVITDIYKVEKLLKDSKDFCFCIFTPKRNYHCAAESWQEVDSWVEKISPLIKK